MGLPVVNIRGVNTSRMAGRLSLEKLAEEHTEDVTGMNMVDHYSMLIS